MPSIHGMMGAAAVSLALLTAPAVAQAAPDLRAYAGVSVVQLRDAAWPAVAQEPAPEFDEGRLVLRFEASTPIWKWFSADVVTMTTAASVQGRRTRATIVSVSMHESLGPYMNLYGRIGRLRTETLVAASERAGHSGSFRIRESHSEPWLGVGIRYRYEDALTLSAEYGGAADGLRSARIAVGWRF